MIALLFLFLPFGVVVIIFLFVNAFKRRTEEGRGQTATTTTATCLLNFSQTTTLLREKTNARSFFEETTSLSLYQDARTDTRKRAPRSFSSVRYFFFFSTKLARARVFLKKK